MNRFTKIGATGLELPDDAPVWVAVKDAQLGLWWSLAETEAMTQPNALKAAAALVTAGFDDWRLPTLAELFALAEHSRYSPAIDVAFFPKCKSAWYFTGTRASYAPAGCAWVVYFADGATTWGTSKTWRSCERSARRPRVVARVPMTGLAGPPTLMVANWY